MITQFQTEHSPQASSQEVVGIDLDSDELTDEASAIMKSRD